MVEVHSSSSSRSRNNQVPAQWNLGLDAVRSSSRVLHIPVESTLHLIFFSRFSLSSTLFFPSYSIFSLPSSLLFLSVWSNLICKFLMRWLFPYARRWVDALSLANLASQQTARSTGVWRSIKLERPRIHTPIICSDRDYTFQTRCIIFSFLFFCVCSRKSLRIWIWKQKRKTGAG